MPGDLIIDTNTLFAPLSGRRGVGLAVSGGPDSMALMLLVAHWRHERPDIPPIFVYSVDHGLRPEAAAEVRQVLAEAEKLDLPARSLRWEGPRPNAGLQAAARKARYRLIGEAMQADGADLLVTGHHLGDQAETVLMRLAHGSGVEGLSGMAEFAFVEGVEIFRPLLAVDPAVLEQVVAAAGVAVVDDPSNRDADYERVRWRQMLPRLAELGLDPSRLSSFARRMGEVDDLIEAEAERAIRESVHLEPGRRAEFPHRMLLELGRPVVVRLLSRLLKQVGDGKKPNALSRIEQLEGRLRQAPALKRTSLHGCLVSSDGTTVTIAREPGRTSGRSSGAQPAAAVTRN